MLKFKGTPKELAEFFGNLIENYGANTTIKEICEMIGAMRNVNL